MQLDYVQIGMRLRTLGPESKVTYFIGFLDSERLERPKGAAAQVANEALELCRQGLIHLVQRRLGPPVIRSVVDWRLGHGPGFEYIAIGAGKRVRP